jgi:hypothetical protein
VYAFAQKILTQGRKVNRPPVSLFVVAVVFLLAQLTQFAPTGRPQANVTGQWQTMSYTMPINPIHVRLLPSGNVLVVTGTGNNPNDTLTQAGLWNPTAGTITVQNIEYDMFCNGMVGLPDGRVLIAGGTLAYNPSFLGYNRLSIYDPATGLFTDEPNMAHGRWYPTATMLGNGSVMIYSGYSETGPTNNTIEIFSESTGLGAPLTTPWTPPLYPRLHLLPNGNIFYSGSTTPSNIYNPTTNTWTMGVAATNYGGTRTYGSSVLLPLTPANNYDPKVMIFGGGSPATATSEIIDLGATTPAWVYGPSMSSPRIEMDATLLPNGNVLLTGGSTNDEDPTTAHLNADMYNLATNTMTSAGSEAYARLYHTVTLLMPDATVWVAGSNPAQGTYQPEMEIYSPPYLFNANGSLATRPTITSLSTTKFGYGSPFTLQTPNAANISSVVLMRNGSSTHAFDMDQRYVGLSFTAGSGVLNLTSPPNSNIAPPGYYMLFILNSSGVPSLANIVQISSAPADVPPTGAITSPTSSVTINAGQTVSFAGSGSSSDSTIASYYWTFFDGTPSSSNVQNPGPVTYSIAGTHTATLTVTDAQGITDPHPPSVSITVPDFTLGVSPTLNSATQGANAAYAITVTGQTGFVGNVSLSVSGLPAGATASFNPATIANSGSSTLSVSTAAVATGSYSLTITATTGILTHSATVTLAVDPSNSTTAINFGSGFSASGLQLEGNAQLIGTALQLTDNTETNEEGNAWWTTPVNVQAFTTDFTFQLTQANANGFTFILQNAGPTAVGLGGSYLGFGSIGTSVGVKFDLFNQAGEGTNSTGLFTDGAEPTVPATTIGGGVNLHSGDVLEAHITYNGTTLTLTITDLTVSASFTTSWPINIPTTVGANIAYVGFGGGTGGLTAIQQILSWTYSTNAPAAATPVITPATGTYSGSQTVSITDGTAASTIYYTLDGSAPSSSTSTKYSGSFTVAATTTVNAIAVATGFSSSPTATSVITIQSGGTNAINFGSGFSAAGMQFNGSAVLNGTAVQLTNTTGSQAGSAYWTTPVNVQAFTTNFTFQLINPNADGFTFVLQNAGLTSVGGSGGGLGFSGIGMSVAVKFDLFSNAGEGNNSTGLYTGGASPTVPATTLAGGVNLHSGDIFNAQLAYNGTTLTLTLTDMTTPADTFTTSWTVNIPTAVGGNTAFAGFTGGTGGLTATQNILTWTYGTGTSLTAAATPTFSPVAGTYTSAQSVTISDATPGSTIYYTLNGTTPNTSSTQFTTTPITVAASETINAIATATGYAQSALGTAAYVISAPTPAATPAIVPATGTYTGTQTVTITDSTAGSTIYYTLNGNPPTTASTKYVGTFTVAATTTVNAIATATGFANSAVATSVITIQSGGGGGGATAINLGSGFSASGMQFNGSAVLSGTAVQLTNTTGSQAGSAYWATPVNVQTFINDFNFQLTTPNADGFTFVLQNAGVTAVGPDGGGLGYSGIGKSVAVKFDLFSNAGEGNNSTGLYTGGASPTVPATTLGGGVNLHSGDTFHVHMVYDGTNLTMTITDTTVPADTFTIAFPINIPATVGGNTAYAGFTGGTGGLTAVQNILNWTYGNTAVNLGSGFSATGMQFNGSAALNGTAVQLTNTAGSQAGSAYWTTPVNVQAFINDFTFQLTTPNADGFTFVLQNAGVTALGPDGGGLGYSGIGKSIAVKFDLFSNAGEGNNSTGLYTGGASPTVPATTLGGGVNLHSGDTFHVHMVYDGTNLTMTITDTTVPADTFTIAFPVNIPAMVGGNTAYAGFTGGTGGLTAVQDILTWTYAN